MRIKREHDTRLEGPIYQELTLLAEVERTPRTSQRSLARKVGISLGLTALVIRQLVEKGYVRARRAGWRSWIYTLTPGGFSRKADLTVAYLQRFLSHFEQAKGLLREELARGALHAESRIAVYGRGELSQLVYLALKELGVDHVDVFGANEEGCSEMVTGVRPEASRRLDGYDRVVLAGLGDAEVERRKLQERGVPQEKVVTLFGSPGKQQQTIPPEPADARRHA